MFSPRRHPLFNIVFRLLLASILLGLAAPLPVQADVGPRPILPGGSSLKPGEQTPIQMAAEVVTMNVRAATQADNALVKLNPGGTDITFSLSGTRRSPRWKLILC